MFHHPSLGIYTHSRAIGVNKLHALTFCEGRHLHDLLPWQTTASSCTGWKSPTRILDLHFNYKSVLKSFVALPHQN